MLNFADRTGYGAFTVLWPQMEGKAKLSYKTGQKWGEGGRMAIESMRRERWARARACLLGDTSLHSRDEQPPDTPRRLAAGRRAGESDCALPSRGRRGLLVRRRDDYSPAHYGQVVIHRYEYIYTSRCVDVYLDSIHICTCIICISEPILAHGQVD